MSCDSIIFDMDGTLWDSSEVVCEAWNKTFAEEGMEVEVSLEELSQCMGLPMNEIADRIFHGYDKEKVKSIFNKAMKSENELLSQRGGILYPELEATLSKLKETKRLFIVSNCQDGYIEAFFKSHSISGYFEDYECFGRTGLQKDENIRLIIERNNLSNPVYVGDTNGDFNAAHKAGVDFIYAAYGFGNVENPKHRIEKFCELPEVMDSIS